MTKWLISAAFGLFCVGLFCLAQAQVPMTGAGLSKPTAGATYTGPGDVVSGANFWYGLRAYNNTYAAAAGNVLIARRSSDSTTCTAKVNTSGALDVTTTYCAGSTNLPNWCAASAGSCFVQQLYDQSGTNSCASAPCNLTQATTTLQPALAFSGCYAGSVCLTWPGTGDKTLTTSTSVPTVAVPFSFAVVAGTGTVASGAFGPILLVDPNTCFCLASWFGNPTPVQFAGNNGPSGFASTASISVSTMYAGVTTYSAANAGTVAVNAAVTSGTNANSFSSANIIYLGYDGSSGDDLNGQILEAGQWPVALNSTQITNLCHNQRLFWGFAGGSC